MFKATNDTCSLPINQIRYLHSYHKKSALQNGNFAARLSQREKAKKSREIVESPPQFSRLLHSKASPGIQSSAKCGKIQLLSVTLS